MTQVTPEYLFQVIGELIIENRLLAIELARKQKEIVEIRKKIDENSKS